MYILTFNGTLCGIFKDSTRAEAYKAKHIDGKYMKIKMIVSDIDNTDLYKTKTSVTGIEEA